MKSFSPALAAHLARRRDDALHVLADHARRRSRCSASPTMTGRSRSTASSTSRRAGSMRAPRSSHAGLQVGGLDVTGAFASEKITESDLEAGLYDNARVEAWLVNWARSGRAASDARRLDRRGAARGRLVHRGDPRARAMRSTRSAGGFFARPATPISATRAAGSISRAPNGRRARRSTATDGFARLTRERAGRRGRAGFFDQGALTFTSGANAGRRSEVLRHVRDDGRRPSRAVAADGEPIAVGRRVHGLGRLRQALRHLPRPLRQRRELSRLSAHAGQRLRAVLSECGGGNDGGSLEVMTVRAAGIGVGSDSVAARRAMRDAGSSRRRGLDRHAVSASGALKGVGCDCLGLLVGVWREISAARPGSCRPTRRTGRRRWGARRSRRGCAASDEIDPGAAREGDLVLFRWRAHLPAKHAGILTAPDRMVHAQERARGDGSGGERLVEEADGVCVCV